VGIAHHNPDMLDIAHPTDEWHLLNLDLDPRLLEEVGDLGNNFFLSK